MLDTRWYTLKEAAERLRISTKTLSGILRQHPHCVRVGRKFIISDADLTRLYETLKSQSVSANIVGGRSAYVQASPSEAQLYEKLRKLTAKPKPSSTTAMGALRSKHRRRRPRGGST